MSINLKTTEQIMGTHPPGSIIHLIDKDGRHYRGKVKRYQVMPCSELVEPASFVSITLIEEHQEILAKNVLERHLDGKIVSGPDKNGYMDVAIRNGMIVKDRIVTRYSDNGGGKWLDSIPPGQVDKITIVPDGIYMIIGDCTTAEQVERFLEYWNGSHFNLQLPRFFDTGGRIKG